MWASLTYPEMIQEDKFQTWMKEVFAESSCHFLFFITERYKEFCMTSAVANLIFKFHSR